MITFLSIAIVISILGVLSYFTSAWFGVRASNTDKLPPHYAHLLQQLKEKERQDDETEARVQNEEIFMKR